MVEPARLHGIRTRVLLVDDNGVNRLLAARLLEKLGCDVTVAASGLDALEQARRLMFDLIIMDCQMPEVDGYQATQRIRSQEGNSSRTPIVAVTAHAMPGDRERCLQAGMDDYFSKPVTGASFVAMLERWGPARA